MTDYLWLIPALPLAGFVVNGLLGRLLGARLVALIGPGVVGASLVLSVLAFLEMLGAPGQSLTQTVFPWIFVGELQVPVAFTVDRLSGLYILIVTGVGFLIHVYSIGYMADEHEYAVWRFFSYLNLFIFFMLILVLGASLLLVFVGWEGVGLCSYLLIGYYYEKHSAAAAAKKAFVVNRIGDFGFIVATLLLFTLLGTLDAAAINARAADVFTVGGPMVTAITLLLFLGVTGKSAQLPLYTWLPDAMEGPTPVSALIHAATMVTAGLYLIARMSHLFVLAPATMAVIATIGAVTAFFAATIGLAQYDIKRVLAYSTVSQLGYMVMAMGVGAFMAGIFHVMTHAFFKALLFLGSGSVIVALHHQQDVRHMGGLIRKMPITGSTFVVGALAISGFPFVMAGFFSKDEILWRAFSSPWGSPVLWAIGAVTAVLTAFYMFRLVGLTFFGPSRVEHHTAMHAREAPPSVTVPLLALAALSIAGGWVGIPHALGAVAHIPNLMEGYFHGFFAPLPVDSPHYPASLELGLMAASTVGALIAMYAAYALYSRHLERVEAWKGRIWPVHALLNRKYFVDELYDRVLVWPTVWVSRTILWLTVDVRVIDWAVNAVGRATRHLGGALRLAQNGVIDNYVVAMVVGAVIILWYLAF